MRLLIDRAVAAARADNDDRRTYRLGAAGKRSDGTIVTSRNLESKEPDRKTHAETRLARKLDVGAEVAVVRLRSDGSLACSKPCKACEAALKAKRVAVLHYVDDEGLIVTKRFE